MYREGMQACTLHFKGSKRYRLIFWKIEGIKQQGLVNQYKC